jgi:hypothetical protein
VPPRLGPVPGVETDSIAVLMPTRPIVGRGTDDRDSQGADVGIDPAVLILDVGLGGITPGQADDLYELIAADPAGREPAHGSPACLGRAVSYW